MRVNIYSDDLTRNVDTRTRDVDGEIYYGVSFELYQNSDELMKPPAVTFWAKDPAELMKIFDRARHRAEALCQDYEAPVAENRIRKAKEKLWELEIINDADKGPNYSKLRSGINEVASYLRAPMIFPKVDDKGPGSGDET